MMRRSFATHRALVAVGALLLVPGCRSPRPVDQTGVHDALDTGITSAELERRHETDTVFVRRVRMFEDLARQVPTDSLAHLYMTALDAPASRGAEMEGAIACEIGRLFWVYGNVPGQLALQHMTDSLFPTAALRRRWRDAQTRWPGAAQMDKNCPVVGLKSAPDSLNYWPRKTIWP